MTEQAPQGTDWKAQLQAAFAAKQAQYGKQETPQAETPATPPAAEATEAQPVETELEQEQSQPVQQAEQAREAPKSEDEGFLSDEPTDTPDVLALKANLRAGFHKKMAALDKRLKDMDEKAGSGLDAQKKAQVLDALLASPDPAAAINAAREGLGVAPKGQEPQQWFKPRVMKAKLAERGKLGEGSEFLAESVIDPIEDMIDAYMEEKVLPGYLPVLAWVQQQVQKGATSEWDGLAAKYGESAIQFQRQAYELAAKAQIPLETALIAASNGAVLQAQKASQVERKQSHGLVKANGLPPANKGESTYAEKRNALAKMRLANDKAGKRQFAENRF